MTPTSPTIQARNLVYETIAQLGITEPGPCDEAVVVRDGFCEGRLFSFENLRAVWLESEGEIEFSNGQGTVLMTIATRGEEERGEQELRRAA